MGAAAIPIAAAGIGAAGNIIASKGQKQQISSPSSQSSTTRSTYSPNSAIMPAYNNVYGLLNYLSGQQTPFFPGQTYVSPSEATRSGVDSLLAAANRQEGVNNTALGNYGFLSGAANVAENPYVQGMLGVNRQQVNQALNENWLPALSSQAQQVNALGSGRAGLAQAQGIERASQQLSNANQQLLNTAYGQGLGAQQYALGQTGALQNALAQPGQTRVAAGGLIEGYQGQALQDAIARFQHQYQPQWAQAQNLLSLLSSSPAYSTGMMTGTGYTQGMNSQLNPAYQSPFAAAAGGASLGFGAYNAWQQSQRPSGGSSWNWPSYQTPGGWGINLPSYTGAPLA